MNGNAETIASEVLRRSGTDLHTIVGSRVWFGVAPATFKNEQAAVVFRIEDGAGGLFGSPVEECSFLMECWGGDAAAGSWAGAAAVWRGVLGAWHDAGKITTDSGVMLQGWTEQRGVPLVHPETKHKYYVCRMAGRFRGA